MSGRSLISTLVAALQFVAPVTMAVLCSPAAMARSADSSWWSPPSATVPDGWKMLTAVVSPANAGRIEMWPYGGAYRDTTHVLASAMPADGFAFVRWENVEGVTTQQSTGRFRMASDRQIKAIFSVVEAPTIEVSVSSVAQLQSALTAVEPGTRIVCEDGTYSLTSSVTITRSGTPTRPIVIAAKNRGAATITGAGTLTLSGVQHVVVDGLTFLCTGPVALDLKNAVGCRVTRNRFLQGATALTQQQWLAISGASGHHNRIDHNEFRGKRTMGNFLSTTTREGIDLSLSQFDVIERNAFVDIGPNEGNGKEAIRLGNSWISMASGYTLIEANYFERCDGDAESVSNKSCDNIYRWNTFYDTWGSLCLRHGNRCVADGNTFIRPDSIINPSKVDASSPIDRRIGGIRAYGDDHVIVNNYFYQTNAGTTGLGTLVLCSGKVNWTADSYPSADLSSTNAADRGYIAFNSFIDCPRSSIDIGYSSGGTTFPANEMTLANNLVVARRGRNPGQVIYLPSSVPAPTGTIWSGNRFAMAGGVTLGNWPTAFTAAEVTIAETTIVKSNGRWTILPTSSAIGSARADDVPHRVCVPWDIDGQARQLPTSVGCDDLSPDSVRVGILTAADVGPDAGIPTSVPTSGEPMVPVAVVLRPNYPNPFNPSTTMEFELPSTSDVRLQVFDLLGREVERLVDGPLPAGIHRATFDASSLSSGTYLVRLTTAGQVRTAKVALMR